MTYVEEQLKSVCKHTEWSTNPQSSVVAHHLLVDQLEILLVKVKLKLSGYTVLSN